MRSARFCVAFLAGTLSTSLLAYGGSVDVSSSTLLKADVTAVLGDAAGPGDSKESHDAGGLSKLDVSAQATASVPIESLTFTGSGASDAHLDTSDAGFVLTGSSSASLVGTTTLAGEVRSVATIDLSFVIQEGFRATPQLSATIDKLVLNDEKVTLVIDRAGDADAIFARTFNDTFGGSLDPLEAGDYRLQLVSGSIATNKGISGETGSAQFQLTLAAEPTQPAAIPLPSALVTGAPVLAIALLAAWRQRVRGSRA